MPLQGDPRAWRAGSRIAEIYRELSRVDTGVHSSGRCRVCDPLYVDMQPRLGTAPFIYRKGGRELPAGIERRRRLRNEIFEVHEHMTSGVWSAPEPASEPTPEPEPLPEPSDAPSAPEPAPEPALPSSDVVKAAERFYSEVQKRRAFVRGRKGMESLDSMRLVIDGVKAIRRGVPVEALISSIEAPWTSETRLQAANFRPSASDLKPIIPEGTYHYGSYAPRPSTFAHEVSAYVAQLVAAGIPVWLHGPAGTGKSSAAHYAADQAGLKYYEVNLAGAMASAVKGKDRLQEFIDSDVMLAYEFGGLCCLEEFSAAHPTVGTALNTLLAADVFHNDANGRHIRKHPDFRVVVTDNSLGYGCAIFKRSALDASTLDRFRMGRVYAGLDLTLERSIFESLLAS